MATTVARARDSTRWPLERWHHRITAEWNDGEYYSKWRNSRLRAVLTPGHAGCAHNRPLPVGASPPPTCVCLGGFQLLWDCHHCLKKLIGINLTQSSLDCWPLGQVEQGVGGHVFPVYTPLKEFFIKGIFISLHFGHAWPLVFRMNKRSERYTFT